MTIPTINFEAQLLRWSETSNGGSTIVLQLVDDGDLAPFKGMTLKKGKMAGQRLQCVLVEVDDQEQPIAPPAPQKGGSLSILAARWCRDPVFQDWLSLSTGDETAAAVQVRSICGVTSRAELDHDYMAAARFEAHIRRPYMEHLQSGDRFVA
jgi:hypothetical protein